MIALFDTTPNFCPNCGKEKKWTHSLQEKGALISGWEAGVSYSCDCGLSYQRVDTEKMLDIAEDLAYYYKISHE